MHDGQADRPMHDAQKHYLRGGTNRGRYRVTTCLENLEMSEFDSCQGNVRDLTKSQGSVGEKIL